MLLADAAAGAATLANGLRAIPGWEGQALEPVRADAADAARLCGEVLHAADRVRGSHPFRHELTPEDAQRLRELARSCAEAAGAATALLQRVAEAPAVSEAADRARRLARGLVVSAKLAAQVAGIEYDRYAVPAPQGPSAPPPPPPPPPRTQQPQPPASPEWQLLSPPRPFVSPPRASSTPIPKPTTPTTTPMWDAARRRDVQERCAQRAVFRRNFPPPPASPIRRPFAVSRPMAHARAAQHEANHAWAQVVMNNEFSAPQP